MKHLFLLALSLTAVLQADVMLFDRGLPTANLNDSIDANRSNTAWADSDLNTIYGDDFNLGTAGTYKINTLRLWLVSSAANVSDNWSSLVLYTGSGIPLTPLSTVSTSGGDPNVSITPTTYTGGVQYVGSSGPINMWAVDFMNLNWIVDGTTTYNFFLGSTGFAKNPHISASNAALSGSTQQGADNMMLYYDMSSPGVVSWDSSGNGWDKSSDLNVQLYGTAVPEPSTIGLASLGILGILVARRKRLIGTR